MSAKNNYPQKEDMKRSRFPLGKINFIMIGICCLMIIVGFAMISGAPSTDTFNPEIFSTRRIIVGPAIAFLGFVFMVIAIMYKGKDRKNGEDEEKKD